MIVVEKGRPGFTRQVAGVQFQMQGQIAAALRESRIVLRGSRPNARACFSFVEILAGDAQHEEKLDAKKNQSRT